MPAPRGGGCMAHALVRGDLAITVLMRACCVLMWALARIIFAGHVHASKVDVLKLSGL